MKLTDEQKDIMYKTAAESLYDLSQGNIGATMFLMDALYSSDEGCSVIFQSLLFFDIKGENAYLLYNDCCKRDVQRVKEVCESLRSGDINIKELRRHIANRMEII